MMGDRMMSPRICASVNAPLKNVLAEINCWRETMNGYGRGVRGGEELAQAREHDGDPIEREHVFSSEEEGKRADRAADVGEDEEAPFAPTINQHSGEDSEDDDGNDVE
jgi:hypothetical protein